jgi:hypothetical protein
MPIDGIRYDKDGALVIWDAEAALPLGVDWSAWLQQQGETALSGSSWTAEAGITLSDTQVNDGVASVIASVETDDVAQGQEIAVTNIVSAGAFSDARTIRVRIQRR